MTLVVSVRPCTPRRLNAPPGLRPPLIVRIERYASYSSVTTNLSGLLAIRAHDRYRRHRSPECLLLAISCTAMNVGCRVRACRKVALTGGMGQAHCWMLPSADAPPFVLKRILLELC